MSDYVDQISNLPNVTLIKYDKDAVDCDSLQAEYAMHYEVSESDKFTIPAIYFGDHYFKLSPENQNEVTKAIDDYISGRVQFENFSPQNNLDDEILFSQIADNMTIAGVLLAGLFDGINPCAISMLTAFFSFLLFAGNKRKLVSMSAFFIAGIFIANLSFGLGIKTIYNFFSGNIWFVAALYLFSLAVCICALTINTIDLINRNRAEEKNQLSDNLKFKLTNIMRKAVFSHIALPAALFVGLLIGAVELACTGQIYLPTLTFLITSDINSSWALFLLLSYNIMFVIPLIGVTIIAGIVKQPEEIKKTVTKNNFILKIISNGFFLLMVIILLKEFLTLFSN